MLFFSFNRLQKSIKTLFFGKVFFIYFKQELCIFNIFRSKIRLRHLDRLSKKQYKKSRGSCCNAQQPPRNMLKFNRIYFPVVE